MIDQILQLVSSIKKDPQSIRFHCHANGPTSFRNTDVKYYEIKVHRDMSFEYPKDNIPIPESKLDSLYAMRYRTSESDTVSEPYYYFGDIFFIPSIGKASNFVLSLKKNKDKTSFDLASEIDLDENTPKMVLDFRKKFKEEYPKLKKLLPEIDKKSKNDKSQSSGVYIHFDFSEFGFENWYCATDVLSFIDRLFAKRFCDIVNINGQTLYTINKSRLEFICSGDGDNDCQFVNFDNETKYKNFSIKESEVGEIYYIKRIINKCSIGLYNLGDYKLLVIPNSKNITFNIFTDYMNNCLSVKGIKSFDKKEKATISTEVVLNEATEESLEKVGEWGEDPFLDVVEKASSEVTSFSVFLVRRGGPSSPDTFILHLSSLERSYLRQMVEQVRALRKDLGVKMGILGCLYSILVPTKNSSDHNYVRMSQKTIASIYTGNYVVDKLIYTEFIENMLYKIRNETLKNFRYEELRNKLLLLEAVQSICNKKEESAMTNSRELGEVLGKMASKISPTINSFEKEYVGLIKFKSMNLLAIKNLKIDFLQKLILHKDDKEGVYYGGGTIAVFEKTSAELLDKIEVENSFNHTDFLLGYLAGYYYRPQNNVEVANIKKTTVIAQ